MNEQILIAIIGAVVLAEIIKLGGKIIFDWLKGKENNFPLNMKTFSIYKNNFEIRFNNLEKRLDKLEEKIDNIYKIVLEEKK